MSWREAEHPRDPANGEFVEKSGWLGRVNDAIDRFVGGAGIRGVRPSIDGASSTKELEAVTRRELDFLTGQQVKVKLKGLDLPLAKLHMEGVLRGAGEFPWAQLREINTTRENSVRDAFTFIVPNRPDRTTLTFNTKRNHAEFVANMARMAALSYYSGDVRDLTHIGAHEYGHVAVGSLPWGAVDGIVGSKPLGYVTRVRDQLGMYALSDDHEMIGEAVADYLSRSGQSSQLGREVVSRLHALNNRVAGRR